MTQINNTYGSGGMSIAFNDQQFSSFIQFSKGQNKIDVVTAATFSGEQVCKKVWVMGSKLQLDSNGEEIPENEYQYMWYNMHTSTSILPIIKLPLSSTPVLHSLLSHLKVVMKHNFYSAILVLSGAVLQLHYSTLQTLGGCPIVVAVGESETGKSTTLLAALALLGNAFIILFILVVVMYIHVGVSTSSYYERGTNAHFLTRSIESTLPFCVDDPQKSDSLSSLIVDLYSGTKIASMRKEITPKCAFMIATNYSISTEEQ